MILTRGFRVFEQVLSGPAVFCSPEVRAEHAA